LVSQIIHLLHGNKYTGSTEIDLAEHFDIDARLRVALGLLHGNGA
jgi:hypothetical protein